MPLLSLPDLPTSSTSKAELRHGPPRGCRWFEERKPSLWSVRSGWPQALIGSAAGYFGPDYWIGLAAFVGAVLVFAGITDICGMGMLLAKMPWNQVNDATTGAPGCDLK